MPPRDAGEAKTARAELVEVGKGRHRGTAATVEDLCCDWIVELRRKGRSPNTVYGYERNVRPTLGKVAVATTKVRTDLYGAQQARRTRGADTRRGPPPARRRRPIEATGVRRGNPRHRHHRAAARAELCALRRQRDIDWDRGVLKVSASIVVPKNVPRQEIPTKNRRERRLALDDLT